MVISAEEHIRKPDKEIFLRACQRLEVEPSECIFVDNDQEHIIAAETLGMQSLLFKGVKDLKNKLKSLNLLK